MAITDFFVKRPAFTIVMMLTLTIVGLLSYVNLPLRWIPSVHPPIVSIYTSYAGASAELIETQVTTPIEAALSGIEGIDNISSNSKQGYSNIVLHFKLGANIANAVEDVRSSLSHVTGYLPKDVTPPYVSKADADEQPILYLAFSDTNLNEKQVTDYVEQFIVPRLQTIEGVSSLMTYGRRASALRVWLDPAKMASSKVTVDDISEALISQNTQIPAGQLRGIDRNYNLVTQPNLQTIDKFNNVIVRHEQDAIVRLKNVANVLIAPLDKESAFRVNGKQAMALGIIPQSTANPLDVSKRVLATYHELIQQLPAGMKSQVVYNEADFIQSSVSSVYEALAEATLCVLLVIFFFLGNWRATIIPVVTIPVCLIATFILLHVFHFTINTITLMAFVLSIGLVVDDAIVMLENISRHIEKGIKPFDAALMGAREMVFPVIAMTLTLAAVYTPIAFTSGLLGAVLSEFALTLAGAVLISGCVALTLTPMMCSRILKSTHSNAYQDWLAKKSFAIQEKYKLTLTALLAQKKKVFILFMVVGLLGGGLYHFIPSELSPVEDRNQINVYVSAPHDASFQYTNHYVEELETIFKTIPELDSFLIDISEGSPSFSFQLLNIKPWNKRHRSIQQIADDLTEKTSHLIGVKVSVFVPPSPLSEFSDNEGSNIAMSLMSVGDYKDLYAISHQLVDAAKNFPQFLRVDSRLKWDRNQYEISIDSEKLADLHVSYSAITNAISTMYAGRTAGKYGFGGKLYDVVLQMDESALGSIDALNTMSVRNSIGNMVSLADVVSMHQTTNPGSLPHYERLRSDSVFANLAPGVTIAQGVAIFQQLAKDVLPDNVKLNFVGEAKSYLESNHKMLFTFMLAIVFIYFILVAQFENFIDPFIILLTVPFAVIGALCALKLTGGSFNIYSNIGLVTLIGLIAKHGILMTEFANTARMQGMTIEGAIVEAATLRLRPILMTTLAMILGALPLAWASGPGSETRHPVGWVIVGGMLAGTFFSLIVVPMAYTFFAKFKLQSYSDCDVSSQILTYKVDVNEHDVV